MTAIAPCFFSWCCASVGGAIATFDYAKWILRYPQFACVGPELAQEYWDEATLYWRNDGTGPVCDATKQRMFLNMLTAHIATLNAPKTIDGIQQPASPLVGRISSASEGSVSVSSEMNFPPGSAQWFNQTTAGAAFYQATAGFRLGAYYAARPTVIVDGIYPAGPLWPYGSNW